MAFLVDRQNVQLFRGLCGVVELTQLQEELRFQLGRAELGIDYLERHETRLIKSLHQVLNQLYGRLIASLESALTCERLLVVPAGILHTLPLHALWNGEQYLVEQYEIVYAPSASIAIHCRRQQNDTGRVENDDLNKNRDAPQRQVKEGSMLSQQTWAGLALADPAIPQAIHEIKTSARFWENSTLYLDQHADKHGLQQAARADILHLATHGLFRPDNPFFSSLKLADGWIDVREIYRLPLEASLVILSACESGAGRVRGCDEVIGLARGFLGAGAQTLLASLWNVHDASVAILMERFYQSLTTSDTSLAAPAAALRTAQITAIREKQHPYFWAPFYVVGRS